MEVKNKFNTVKIATCNDAHKAEAVSQLFERSLLFNRSDDICGIVISKNDEKQFIPISAIPDNVNIEKRDGVVTLVENPVVDSITTKADPNGVDWKSQHKIAATSAERTIILLFLCNCCFLYLFLVHFLFLLNLVIVFLLLLYVFLLQGMRLYQQDKKKNRQSKITDGFW